MLGLNLNHVSKRGPWWYEIQVYVLTISRESERILIYVLINFIRHSIDIKFIQILYLVHMYFVRIQYVIWIEY